MMLSPRFAIQFMIQRSQRVRNLFLHGTNTFSALQSLLPCGMLWGNPLSLNFSVLNHKVAVMVPHCHILHHMIQLAFLGAVES